MKNKKSIEKYFFMRSHVYQIETLFFIDSSSLNHQSKTLGIPVRPAMSKDKFVRHIPIWFNQ